MKFSFVLFVAMGTAASAVIAACGSSGSSTYVHGDGGDGTIMMDGTPIMLGDTGKGGHPSCTPETCKTLGYTCGPAGDGCGNKIECGTCKAPETCGGGGGFSKCGGSAACVPKTCKDLGIGCGPAGDGCGGKLDCGSCTAPDSCGGGGVHSECGVYTPPDAGPDGGLCKPLTCKDQGISCGPAGDGCGGKIASCGSCKAGESCGGGGTSGVCGTGTTMCIPTTCAKLGISCGPAGDGCGGLLDCDGDGGGCPPPTFCGGGGKPGVCGGVAVPDGGFPDGGGICAPFKCSDLGFDCGPAGDGCGGLLNCGICEAGTCGGGGVAGTCGSPKTCKPATCASLGLNCGPAADGCGGLLDCDGDSGGCTPPNICGGGGVPGQCGDLTTCTGLCADVPTCVDGGTTTLSGTVIAGTNGIWLGASPSVPDPVPNVFVYIPNAKTVKAFNDGPECGCATVSGSPLEGAGQYAYTDYQGNFTLTNVPVPKSGIIPLVIQLGRWRRVYGLGNALNPGFNVTACTPNNAGNIVMPHNHNEGDIPLTAVSTGNVDQLECVLLKMGVDQSEFTNFGGGGRIQFFQGNGAVIANDAGVTTPPETTLIPDSEAGAPNLALFDQVLFPCWGDDPRGGGANVKTGSQLNNVINYTNVGGRIFNTHFSYSWLYNVAPFDTTAAWNADIQYNSGTGNIAVPSTFADVTTFDQWMNALTTNGSTADQFTISTERNDFTNPASNTETWVNITGATKAIAGDPTAFPVTYTFNTPYVAPPAPPATCGRVIYSDFHVVGTGSHGGNSCGGGTCDSFPAECGAGGEMTAQEKSLEYLIWDLASCPPTPPPPTCTPNTCKALGYTCGSVPDGCSDGGTINCGTCSKECETCGGGGKPGVCGGTCCVPDTCKSLGFSCGSNIPDGCGGTIASCGMCPPGETCGGGGVPGMCGAVDGGGCTPQTCKLLGFTCGSYPDGCGGTLNCGGCGDGGSCETCGGGGVAGVCGGTCCKKETCKGQGISCGPAGDGCGGSLNCGPCTPPDTCGGGGKPGVCGAPDGAACVPLTCMGQGIDCGPAGDGCGGSLSCGTCPKGETCGGGGVSGKCGKPICSPKTCKELGFDCGPAGDGCGGTLNCGKCKSPDTCGGGGTPGVCGMPISK